LGELRELLAGGFTVQELLNLAFDMRLDYASLPKTIDALPRELIAASVRRPCVDELVARARKLHPNLDWEKVLPPGSSTALDEVTSHSQKGSYVASKRSKSYHYPDCYLAARIKLENRVTYSHPAAARKNHLPCRHCRPPTAVAKSLDERTRTE
jgi:hypothetical protein